MRNNLAFMFSGEVLDLILIYSAGSEKQGGVEMHLCPFYVKNG